MKVFAAVFAGVVGVVLLLLFASFFTSVLWYCIDDRLAVLLDTPELGTLPLSFVWPLLLLIGSLFRGAAAASSNSNN